MAAFDYHVMYFLFLPLSPASCLRTRRRKRTCAESVRLERPVQAIPLLSRVNVLEACSMSTKTVWRNGCMRRLALVCTLLRSVAILSRCWESHVTCVLLWLLGSSLEAVTTCELCKEELDLNLEDFDIYELYRSHAYERASISLYFREFMANAALWSVWTAMFEHRCSHAVPTLNRALQEHYAERTPYWVAKELTPIKLFDLWKKNQILTLPATKGCS